MALATLTSTAELFGVGATVGAYLPSTNPGAASPVTGAAATTAVVASDGSLTFTGLADDTAYVAYDGARSRRFRTPVAAAASARSRTKTVSGDYTVTAADVTNFDLIRMIGAAAQVVTVPANIGTGPNPADMLAVRQEGAGGVSFAMGAGLTSMVSMGASPRTIQGRWGTASVSWLSATDVELDGALV